MKKYIIFAFVLCICVPMVHLQELIRFISTNGEKENKEFEIKLIKNEGKKCENRKTIDFSEMKLTNKLMKDSTIQSDDIRNINLEKNSLEKIPNSVLRNVPYLDCLNLRDNHINLYDITHTLLQHAYLRVLDISYQNVKPNIYENMIIESEEIEEETTEDIYESIIFNTTNISAPNMKYLDISGNQISSLTYDFKKSFPQLTHLYLININAPTLEESFFDQIPYSLQVLHLEYNQLINLKLKNLANITSLYLDGNPLKSIYISSLSLHTLSISNCTELDTVTFDVPYLEKLDMSGINVKIMSNIRLETQSLKTLILDYNKFLEVPLLTAPPQLLELSLSYNMIREIKANRFRNLISLKKLSLRGNKIDIIEENAFLGLQKLEYLDLSENNLERLSYNWYNSFENLKHLNLNSNKFATIFNVPVLFISSLQHLSVKNNLFKIISTTELETLPNMTTIYVA